MSEHTDEPLPQPPQLLIDTLFPDQNGTVHGISLYTPRDDRIPPTPVSSQPNRPHVTLTFAQSIDGKIAGKGGQQLLLSGRDSLIMTHWMRTMHDAILVGIGTALNDDPQLNTRHVPALPSGTPYRYHLPRPIILDRYLRLSHNCKLLNNYRDGKGRRPWIFSSVPSQEELTAWNVRRTALEIAGAKVYITAAHGGLISLPDVLLALKNLHIRSLMVEGGANVIQSFLKETLPDPQGKVNPIVDTVIVTVAPTLVGPQGIAYDCNLPVKLNHIRTAVFGRDAVMALKFANI